jgi:DNA-binding IclR family transcriptional regulator
VKNGYAEDCEGFVEGVSTLAVPVYSFDGTMTHTLGVFAVDSQLEEPMRQEILDALWTLANDVHPKLVC